MGIKPSKVKNIFSPECCEVRIKHEKDYKKPTNYNFDINEQDTEPHTDTNQDNKKNIIPEFVEFTANSFRS